MMPEKTPAEFRAEALELLNKSVSLVDVALYHAKLAEEALHNLVESKRERQAGLRLIRGGGDG